MISEVISRLRVSFLSDSYMALFVVIIYGMW